MKREETKIISDICPLYKEYGTCEQCNSELDIDDEPCYWECVAKCIVRNDYRKVSEVIEEVRKSLPISREFNSSEIAIGYEWALADVRKAIAELKKKYE